jgi:hypothetical protein
MKVRTKAFFQVLLSVGAVVGLIFLLQFMFGDYGIVIYLAALALYMIYGLYNLRVSMLEREQEKIVDILKE